MTSAAPTTPQSILLLGVGELGIAVLSALSSDPALRNTKLTILLRPSTLASYGPTSPLWQIKPDVCLIAADISTIISSDLARQIAEGGFDIMVSCTGFAAGAGTQLKIADAAILAARGGPLGGNISLFVPWQFGVDYDVTGDGPAELFAEQCLVRRRLREYGERNRGDGLEWLIVSTGMFMSFLFEEWFGVVEGLRGAIDNMKADISAADDEVVVRALGGWENAVTVTTAEDIGKVLAELLKCSRPKLPINIEKKDKGGIIVYCGGETVMYGRLADIVENALGKKVKREVWTVDFLEGELEKDTQVQLQKYRVVFAKGKGVSWPMENTVNSQRDIKTTDVEGWLRNLIR